MNQTKQQPIIKDKVTIERLVLVGCPNVGKSSLFQALSDAYVEVSNYPGTTVEITSSKFGDKTIIDTPGAYGISGLNQEEQITKNVLLSCGPSDVILNVISSVNLARDLFLTLHLLDAGLKTVVILNQIDELHKSGYKLDIDGLARMLGIKVFATSALNGEGIPELKTALQNLSDFTPPNSMSYVSDCPDDGRSKLEHLLWLEEDNECKSAGDSYKPNKFNREKIYSLRRKRADRLAEAVLQTGNTARDPWQERLNRILIHPIYGSAIAGLLFVFLLYQFLGIWVAGDLVSILEVGIFERHINPAIRSAAAQIFPTEIRFSDGEQFVLPNGAQSEPNIWRKQELHRAQNPSSSREFIFGPWDEDAQARTPTKLKSSLLSAIGTILVGKYGLLTLAITYLLGVLLPLVWFFYLAWSILEDTGYLPRLALLSDGLLRRVGLNGRGIIPLVLGLGCVTMAVVTTRLMTNRREQLIALILLGLAVPCSAQLGIIQGLLVKAGGFFVWAMWLSVILTVFFVSGGIANRLMPGRTEPLMLDLPPLRLPQSRNLLRKTNQKAIFFLWESGIAFFAASLVIGIMQVTGGLSLLIAMLKPFTVDLLHLPPEVALSFLLGMVRRDFGAFGLLDLNLTAIQAITASVALTLFVPCIATLSVMIKERNLKTALGIWIFAWLIGFLVGGLLTRLLEMVGFTG